MSSVNLFLLAKIPFILASCIGTQVTWTAPAQSGKAERVPAKSWEEAYINTIVPYAWCIKLTWWAIGVAEILTILLHEFVPSSPLAPPHIDKLRLHPLSVLGVILICLGAGIRHLCYKTMAAHFTFELSIRSKHKLVTSGPYSVVRHPSYSGHGVVYVGLVLWHGLHGSYVRESGILRTVIGGGLFSTFVVILVLILYCLLSRAPVEDAKLQEFFGKEWEDYARRVPYAVCPGVI